MSIHPILKMGNPLLYQKSRLIKDPKSSMGEIQIPTLVQDMRETLENAQGIGLAAPQIGVNLRIMLVSVPKARMGYSAEWPNGVPLTVLINPKITVLDPTETEDWESCLSIPGLAGWVPRPKSIHVDALNEDGTPFEWIANNFHARVVLHEYDHLDGILYPQRLKSSQNLIFTSEMIKNAS